MRSRSEQAQQSTFVSELFFAEVHWVRGCKDGDRFERLKTGIHRTSKGVDHFVPGAEAAHQLKIMGESDIFNNRTHFNSMK
jgi:hypothetical protein